MGDISKFSPSARPLETDDYLHPYERMIVDRLRALGDRILHNRNFDRLDYLAVREAAVLVEVRALEHRELSGA